MPEQPPPHISLKLEGSPQDQGLVRAQDFVAFVSAALACLRRLEGARMSRTKVVYRVVDLSVSSAVVELEASSPEDVHALASKVVENFLTGLTAVQEGMLEFAGYEPELRDAFSAVLTPLQGHARSLTVESDARSVTLTSVPPAVLEPGVQSMSVGTFAGFVDAVNVHKTPVFYLYPSAGPSRIPCVFDRHTLLEEVRQAIKRYTTVHGLMEFQPGSSFPSRITADRIEVNPPESELPTLRSLYGIAPDLTHGLDSVTFVRQLRDAEE